MLTRFAMFILRTGHIQKDLENEIQGGVMIGDIDREATVCDTSHFQAGTRRQSQRSLCDGFHVAAHESEFQTSPKVQNVELICPFARPKNK